MNAALSFSEIIDISIACIYADSETIVGTGFAITVKHVVTCAHVVNEALRRDINEYSSPKNDARILLSFPLAISTKFREELNAKIVAWIPRGSNFTEIEDIVILEVIDSKNSLPIPKFVSLKLNDYFNHRTFKTFGFNLPEGSWAHGKVAGRTADHSIQLNMEGLINHGFSGAPVWDKEERGVIGMLVAVREQRGLAYMIPLSILLDIWPDMAKVTLPRNPYRGLFAFEEQHQRDFFGREKITAELVQRVQQTPFLLLIGASGSGKSSLLNAGLAAQLRSHNDWLILKARPSNAPVNTLAKAVVNELYSDPIERAKQSRILAESLEQQTVHLTDICETLIDNANKHRLLVIVDQFEELYTNTPDLLVQQHYIDMLLSLADSGVATLLLSLRADFMARVTEYHPLTQMINQHSENQLILSGVTAKELETIITQPAQQMGVSLEAGLVERMLNELQEKKTGRLPLLEFALAELWQRQQGHVLTHASLNEVGGISQAIAQHAERALCSSELKDYKIAVERIMVQLILPGAGTEDTRQIAHLKDFSGSDQSILPLLASQRLIITGSDAESRVDTVEIIHEALIQEWRTLREWIDKHREFRTWQKRLRERCFEWEYLERPNEGLLSGRYLLEAREFLQSSESMLSESDKKFIYRSIKISWRHKLIRQGVILGFFGIISLTVIMIIWQGKKTEETFNNAKEIISSVPIILAEDKWGKSTSKNKFESLIESDFVDPLVLNSVARSLPENNTFRKKIDDKIEILFERRLKEKPNDARNLILYANFMYTIRHNNDKARSLYVRAINADPNNIENLTFFSIFMLNGIGDKDEAKNLYDKAIKVDSKNIDALISLAHSLSDNLGDKDRAKNIYDKAIKIDPNNVEALITFARFLSDDHKSIKEARKFYENALRVKPDDADNLLEFAKFMSLNYKEEAENIYNQAIKAANYSGESLMLFAGFYHEILKDNSSADYYYKSAYEEDPENVDLLIKYANFLYGTLEGYSDIDRINLANELYQKAAKYNPNNAWLLDSLARFFHTVYRDFDKAEVFYAMALNFNDGADMLGNYSQFKLIKGDYDKGKELLKRSFDVNAGKNKSLDLELWFYRLAHFPQEHPDAQYQIIELLKQGVRSYSWSFSLNIEQAKKHNHPDIELLQALADVINGKVDFDTIESCFQKN